MKPPKYGLLAHFVKHSKLATSFGVYTVAGVLGSAVPFVTAPIFTRYLSPAEYGTVAMFLVLVGLVTPFAGMSVAGALSVWYVEREKIDLPAYVTNALGLVVAMSIVVALVCYAGRHWIERWTAFPTQWLWAVVVCASGFTVVQVVLGLWQMQGKPIQFGVFQIAFAVVTGALGVVLVVAFGWGWRGRVGGQVLGTLCLALVGLLVLKRNGWLHLAYNRSAISEALAFGVPLIPHTIGAWIITMTDRVFIAHYADVSEVGVYSAGVQLGMVISLLGAAFVQAYVPFLFEKLKTNAGRHSIVRLTYIFDVVILLLALALGALAPTIMAAYVGKNFADAHRYVLWIALGNAFNAMYKMVSLYIFYAKKTHILAWITLVAGFSNLAANIVLVPSQGALGAAKSQAIAWLVSFLLTWILANRAHPMPWALRADVKANIAT